MPIINLQNYTKKNDIDKKYEIFSNIDTQNVQIEPNNKVYLWIYSNYSKSDKEVILDRYKINIDNEIAILTNEKTNKNIDLDYLTKRIETTKNPYLKNYYLIQLFVRTKNMDLLSKIVENLDIMFKAFTDIDGMDGFLYILAKNIDQSLSLCLTYNQMDEIGSIIDLINQLIQYELDQKIFNANYNLVNIYLKHKKIKSDFNWNLVEEVLWAQINAFPKEVPLNYSGLQMFYNNLLKLYQRNKNKEKINELYLKKIHRLELDLENKELPYPLRLDIFDDLIKTLKLLDNKEKLNEVKNKKLKCAKKISKQDMKLLSYSSTIKYNDVKQAYGYLQKLKPLFRLYLLNNKFNEVDLLSKDNQSLIDLFGKFTIEPDGRILKDIGGFSIGNAINLMIGYLKMIFNIHFSDPEITEALVNFISIAYPHRKNLLLHGLMKAYYEDFISSIYVLVFQIEGILRDILECNQISLYRKDKDGNDVLKLFGNCLNDIREKKLLKPTTIKILEYYLGNEGRNLRNNIAHGTRNFKLNTDDYYILILSLIMIPEIEIVYNAEKQKIFFNISSIIIDEDF